MFWAPQSRYVAAAAPTPSREAGESREPPRCRKAKAASPSRSAGAASSRLFGLGSLAPVLDGEQRASPPVVKPRPQLQQRLQPIAGQQRESVYGGGSCPSNCGANPAVSAQATRRSTSPRPSTAATAVAATGAFGRAREDVRLQMRSPWPNLALHGKDAAAAEQWYFRVEAQLARAFPDCRCLYPWLDPLARGGPQLLAEEAQRPLAEPYTFSDFMEGWDFPDASQFAQWCEERRDSQMERTGCDARDNVEAKAAGIGSQQPQAAVRRSRSAGGGLPSPMQAAERTGAEDGQKKARDSTSSIARATLSESPRRSRRRGETALLRCTPAAALNGAVAVSVAAPRLGSGFSRQDGGGDHRPLQSCRGVAAPRSPRMLTRCNSAR
mmetsp:Transcript_78769/g.156000  ORF Transcript_78769/g.156000 Transcript_78769/m.156000 type:complete len:382 (-) Transcript_78769:239-1384(-)